MVLTKVIVFKSFKVLKTLKHSEKVQIVGYINTNYMFTVDLQ